MEKGKAYLGMSENQPPASFTIMKTPTFKDGEYPNIDDLGDQVFYGESDPASTLFGWAIVQTMVCRGQSSMMIFNTQEQVAMPNGARLGKP
jgi:hypothetical protein